MSQRPNHEFSGSPLKQVITPPSGFDNLSPDVEEADDGDADAEEDVENEGDMDMTGPEGLDSDHLGQQGHFSHEIIDHEHQSMADQDHQDMIGHDHHDMIDHHNHHGMGLDQGYHISDDMENNHHFHHFHHSNESSDLHEPMADEVDEMLLNEDMFNGSTNDFDGEQDDNLLVPNDPQQEHSFTHSMDDDLDENEMRRGASEDEENFVDLLGTLEDHLHDDEHQQEHEHDQHLEQNQHDVGEHDTLTAGPGIAISPVAETKDQHPSVEFTGNDPDLLNVEDQGQETDLSSEVLSIMPETPLELGVEAENEAPEAEEGNGDGGSASLE